MKNRSKMILGLASLLGVTAGATAVSGFAWFVTTKTADVDVTNIGVYNKNPSLSVTIDNLKGVKRTNNTANDFNLQAANDTTSLLETFTGDGSETEFALTGTPLATPTAYVNGEVVATTYDSVNNKVIFDTAPDNGKEIRVVYCDKAALTDVSSFDANNFYKPIWQVANEGKKATLIDDAKAGEQYISFDLNFIKPTTGSLKIFLDRPHITANNTSKDEDKAAAEVARVGFYTNQTALILSNKADVEEYQNGITKAKVEDYDGTHVDASDVPGDYDVSKVVAGEVTNLAKPYTENYSIRSTAPTADAAHMYIGEVTSAADLTVHVSIWLEGTSAIDDDGNYSAPIGGEINVDLPIVAFGA